MKLNEYHLYVYFLKDVFVKFTTDLKTEHMKNYNDIQL